MLLQKLLFFVVLAIILAGCSDPEEVPEHIDRIVPRTVGHASGTPGDLSIRLDWVRLHGVKADIFGNGQAQVVVLLVRPATSDSPNGDSRKLVAPGQHTYAIGSDWTHIDLSGFSLTANHVQEDESMVLAVIVLDVDDPNVLQSEEASFAIDSIVAALSELLAGGLKSMGASSPVAFVLGLLPSAAVQWWQSPDVVAAYWMELTPENNWYKGTSQQAPDAENNVLVQFSIYGVESESQEPTSPKTSPSAPTDSNNDLEELQVRSNALNMRGGPGPNFPIIAQYGRGTHVQVLERRPDTKWIKVSVVTTGEIGWMHSDYLVAAQGTISDGLFLQVPTPLPSTSSTPLPRLLDLDVTWISIPSGTFAKGSDDNDIAFAVNECNRWEGNCQSTWFDSESPKKSVSTAGYSIMKFEVTNAQYSTCVAAGACQTAGRNVTDNNIPYDSDLFLADHPVVGVNFYDAASFCTWIGARLPTEDEWEKAARGTDSRIYPWGNSMDSSFANLDSQVSTAVGSYSGGVSPYGVWDMAGNAFEWTATNVRGRYVLRGGSWHTYPFRARVADRGTKLDPGFANYDIGFRCVR